jgi:hypothetical protein
VLIPSLLVVALAAYAIKRLFLGYPHPSERFELVRPREVAFLDAAAEAVFPAGGAVPLAGRDAALPAYADRFATALPRRTRLQVRAMFMLFEQATILFPAPGPHGRRRFSALSAEQRIAVLDGWATSRLFPRRLAFTALRAVLTMGYLAHPAAMRALRLAPFDIESPICEADLLYPRVGQHPETIRLTRGDLTPAAAATKAVPLRPDDPLHPRFATERS